MLFRSRGFKGLGGLRPFRDVVFESAPSAWNPTHCKVASWLFVSRNSRFRYDLALMYGPSGEMADASDLKSEDGLLRRVGSTPTSGTNKTVDFANILAF